METISRFNSGEQYGEAEAEENEEEEAEAQEEEKKEDDKAGTEAQEEKAAKRDAVERPGEIGVIGVRGGGGRGDLDRKGEPGTVEAPRAF